MARVGGRNAYFAWIVGIGCAAVLGVLAFLALPLLPAAMVWVGGTVDAATGRAATGAADASGPGAEASGVPTECAHLYDQALWATMRFSDGSSMTPSVDAPTTTAASVVSALQPQVSFTCDWHATAGSVTTTLATVPTDAGAILEAALPGAGFVCEPQGERTRCTRTEGELIETIETGAGLWLSTSQSGWHPAEYVRRTAERVWG